MTPQQSGCPPLPGAVCCWCCPRRRAPARRRWRASCSRPTPASSCRSRSPRAHRGRARWTAATTSSATRRPSSACATAGALLEWASVHGNLYGTPQGCGHGPAGRAGKDVLFDIDWQGAQQLKEKAPDDLVRVFILPPSAGALEERLRKRAQDGADVVARRLAAAVGRDRPLGRVRVCHRQRRRRRRASRGCAPFSAPERLRARAPARARRLRARRCSEHFSQRARIERLCAQAGEVGRR